MKTKKKTRKRQLRMYVWKDVLEDWSSGIVAVAAYDEAHAWDLLKQEDETAWARIRDVLGPEVSKLDTRTPDQLPPNVKRPVEVTEPGAFVVWGGG